MAVKIKVEKGRHLSYRVFSIAEKSNEVSQSKEYDELEAELKRLLEEIKRLEKDVKKKIQKELLPLIRREIEKLRKWLHEFHPDDEPEPQKVPI